MANFIPLYVFISIIPIGFILIGWYSIQATREASVMGSSSKMGETVKPEMEVDIEMQDINVRRHDEGTNAVERNADDSLPKVLSMPSATTIANRASRGPQDLHAAGCEAGIGTGSTSRSRAPRLAPTATTTAPAEGPRSGPYVPAYKPWWELTDDDTDDRLDPVPSLERNAAVPGRFSVFRTPLQGAFEAIKAAGGRRREWGQGNGVRGQLDRGSGRGP